MAYSRHTWAAGPSGGTPITYTKLNEMEVGILGAHNLVATAQSTANTANSQATTNKNDITGLKSRVTIVESKNSSQDQAISTLSSDVQQLSSDVTAAQSSLTNMGGAIDGLESSVDGHTTQLGDHEERIGVLETSGGGGGGTTSLSFHQYVNNGIWTVANNAWLNYPVVVARPGTVNGTDMTIASTSRGILKCVSSGLYLMSMTVVDTANPSGQANFLCNTVRVSDNNASSVLSVLARFQHYGTNMGSGTAVFALNQGDLVAFQFRQNATGGSMTLPDGVAAVNNGTYVGCALTFVKLG